MAQGFELRNAPLGQLALVGGQNEGHVRKDGALEVEGVVDQNLAQGVGQVLLGTAEGQARGVGY